MAERVNLGKAYPPLYQSLASLDGQVSAAMARTGFSEGFSHLLRLRASQLNACAYCIRLHTRDALKHGESTDRVALVAAWRETCYFDERERAALALVECITRIGDGGVPDDVYASASQVLSDMEIGAVEWLGVVINAWNRVAIPSRYDVGVTGE